ncbi:calpain-1 catalytic subunit-like [Etheostoma cragini]|uniref:calpain-1 catalytic subunit-like n=1 Tax=Etheostoma cragini TaxID=417921 RepID=UPI00155E1BF9|nr:calpain-1 catalytic subunit-like [Etheostoma cragini]
MRRSQSTSSEVSLPPPEDDVDSVCSDELFGSQSRRWLADLMTRGPPAERGDVLTTGRDGLFVDYNFPVGELEMQPGVKWKRPKEICPCPQFVVDGASRLDIRQGKLADCWLLSAIASLSQYPSLLKHVMPPGQSFQDGYNGCFAFRVKHLNASFRPRLKGGYRALNMGLPHEAMVDMTGGVAEVLNISTIRDLTGLLRYLLDKGALINCANSQGPLEQGNELGIMFRHAYSLTAVEKVKTAHGAEDLVRILNPWGNTEWQGPWSDMKGPEWNTVSFEEQKRLGRISREDGEFWMSVSDFRQNFELMEVCHRTDQSGTSGLPWCCIMHHGNWVPSISAGGPANGSKTNCLSGDPLEGPDPKVGNHRTDASHQTLNLKVQGSSLCSDDTSLVIVMTFCGSVVCISVFYKCVLSLQAPRTNKYLSPEDFTVLQPVLFSPHYSSRREVVLRGSLQPGRYIIIPSTAEPNQQGAFLLRVLTEQGNAATPANKPSPQDSSITERSFPHQDALPSLKSTEQLFNKHCKTGICKPVHLYSLLTEIIQGGVLAGSEKYLALEHCKSLVILMGSQGSAQLTWQEFQGLWDKITRWTDIFLVFDRNKSKRLEYQEVAPALKAAGIMVDDLIIQLVGLRYTEPDLTVSYPGFLFLLMKLESMIRKGGIVREPLTQRTEAHKTDTTRHTGAGAALEGGGPACRSHLQK